MYLSLLLTDHALSLLMVLAIMLVDALGKVHYAPKHPMKPPRLMMTHHLIVSYGLHEHLDMFVSRLGELFMGMSSITVFCGK